MPPLPKKRVSTKKILFWLAIGFPLVVVFVLVCLWYIGAARLNSQLAALRAKGLPTNASELNAFYKVPEGVKDTTDLWVAAIDAVEAANPEKRGATLPILGNGPMPIPAPGEAWPALEASRALMHELDSEIKLIRTAAASVGQVRYPVDFRNEIGLALTRHSRNTRSAARIMDLDAQVSAHDGNHSQALGDIKAIFALADTLRSAPSLPSQLERLAIYTYSCGAVVHLLPHCDWNDSELRMFQTAILSANFKDELSIELWGEQAMCLDIIDQLPLLPLRHWNKQETIRCFEIFTDAVSGSWPHVMSQQQKFVAYVDDLSTGRINRLMLGGLWLVLPALDSAVVASMRAAVRQKCVNVIIAAQRHRLRHGQLPNSLAEIERELLGTVSNLPADVIDPFTGRPLIYKTKTDHVLIYSVGKNEQDDGGDVDRNAQRRQPLDVGFSLNMRFQSQQ